MLLARPVGVWEVIRDYKALRGDRRKVLRAFPHLSAAGVQAALTYYGRYSEEIDEAIADNAAAYEAGKLVQAKAVGTTRTRLAHSGVARSFTWHASATPNAGGR